MGHKHSNLSAQIYGWVCGRELEANLLHFQFLPAFYARRDIKRDGARLKGRLLDLGCGNQPYRRYLTGVTKYVGLDYPLTREFLEPAGRPEVHGDARALPFADHSFDSVLCSQVLEHVDQPGQVLREMARVLKPGGVGLISVPFFYNLHMEPHDYFRFSPYGLQNLVISSGFALLQLRGQGGIGSLLVQMFHNWLFSGVARKTRRNLILKAIFLLILPFLLLLSSLNNLAALALDRLSHDDLRFTPNLWVVVEKTPTREGNESWIKPASTIGQSSGGRRGCRLPSKWMARAPGPGSTGNFMISGKGTCQRQMISR